MYKPQHAVAKFPKAIYKWLSVPIFPDFVSGILSLTDVIINRLAKEVFSDTESTHISFIYRGTITAFNPTAKPQIAFPIENIVNVSST